MGILNKYKNSKRFKIILLAALTLILGIVCIGIWSAKDGSTRLIVAAPSERLNPGEEFEVGVALENNPGIVVFCLWLSYDPERFELVSVTKGEVLDGQLLESKDVFFNGAQTVRVTNGLRTDAFTGEGGLYSVKFRVKAAAVPGKANFALIYREGDIVGEPKQPGNQSNNFAPATIDGTVTI